MALSRRSRAKGIARSQELLGPDAQILSYAVGTTGPDPRRTIAFIILGNVALAAVLAVALHVIFRPGLLTLLIYYGFNRPVGVVRLPKGLVLVRRSAMNGRPIAHIGTLALDALNEPTCVRRGGWMYVADARLWMRKKEYEALLNAPSPA